MAPAPVMLFLCFARVSVDRVVYSCLLRLRGSRPARNIPVVTPFILTRPSDSSVLLTPGTAGDRKNGKKEKSHGGCLQRVPHKRPWSLLYSNWIPHRGT